MSGTESHGQGFGFYDIGCAHGQCDSRLLTDSEVEQLLWTNERDDAVEVGACVHLDESWAARALKHFKHFIATRETLHNR